MMPIKVEYFEAYPELMPGIQFFSCSAIGATLRPAHCGARHDRACRVRSVDDDSDQAFTICRQCPVGARHAGKEAESPLAPVSPLPAFVCSRCSRGTMRMIGGQICVSCYNREQEARKGRNARGTKPITFQPLRRHHVAIDDGRRVRWLAFEVQNGHEPLVRALRGKQAAALVEERPGRVAWDPDLGFHYVDQEGAVLTEDPGAKGEIRYRPRQPGEAPARVAPPTMMIEPGTLRTWLEVSDCGDDLTTDWQWQSFGCARCRRGVLRARRRSGCVQCRCAACGVRSE
ncbi:hypothetical protein [Afifella aestuarii]|uniref:hypothetical protein n=1 Tax=Afifella aestuarii TaxID=1909496 RepID=UPI000FE40A0E|nr:hypothetical protein [Afifella aestuarii]